MKGKISSGTSGSVSFHREDGDKTIHSTETLILGVFLGQPPLPVDKKTAGEKKGGPVPLLLHPPPAGRWRPGRARGRHGAAAKGWADEAMRRPPRGERRSGEDDRGPGDPGLGGGRKKGYPVFSRRIVDTGRQILGWDSAWRSPRIQLNSI